VDRLGWACMAASTRLLCVGLSAFFDCCWGWAPEAGGGDDDDAIAAATIGRRRPIKVLLLLLLPLFAPAASAARSVVASDDGPLVVVIGRLPRVERRVVVVGVVRGRESRAGELICWKRFMVMVVRASRAL
jgi:hypothetical protein